MEKIKLELSESSINHLVEIWKVNNLDFDEYLELGVQYHKYYSEIEKAVFNDFIELNGFKNVVYTFKKTWNKKLEIISAQAELFKALCSKPFALYYDKDKKCYFIKIEL